MHINARAFCGHYNLFVSKVNPQQAQHPYHRMSPSHFHVQKHKTHHWFYQEIDSYEFLDGAKTNHNLVESQL